MSGGKREPGLSSVRTQRGGPRRASAQGQLLGRSEGRVRKDGEVWLSLHTFFSLKEGMCVCMLFSLLGTSWDKWAEASLYVLLQQPCIRFSTTELKPMIHNQFRLRNVLLIDQTETNFSVGNWTLRKLITRQAKPISFGPSTAYCMLLRDDLAVERKAML